MMIRKLKSQSFEQSNAIDWKAKIFNKIGHYYAKCRMVDNICHLNQIR